MSAVSKPTILPDRNAPSEARTVDDLCALVSVGEQITFTRTVDPVGDDPYFFTVKLMGEYMNNGLVRIDWPQDPNKPSHIRNGPGDEPLAAFPGIRLAFQGDVRFMSDLYDLTPPLHVLSDALYRFILQRDPGSLEAVPLTLPSPEEAKIARFWLVRPSRILDAVDVTKTNVTIWRRAIRDTDRSFTTVSYEPDFAIGNLASNCMSFGEKQTKRWLWSEDLLRAAERAGFHGLYAHPTYRRDFLTELRLVKRRD